MDNYDKEHYKLNKFLLVFTGLWPGQSSAWKWTARFTIGLVLLSMMLPLVIRIKQEWGKNVDEVIENSGSLGYCLICTMKYLSTIVNEKKLKILYEAIAKDWKSTTDINEIQELEKHEAYGKQLTIGYTLYMYGACTGFCMLPLTPQTLDIILPLNQSRPKQHVYHGNYLVNREDYFYEIFFHGFLSTLVTVAILTAVDTMYACCVEHVCGRFAIVESRLKEAVITNDEGLKMSSDIENQEYKNIISTVVCHKQAIEFSQLLESSYSSSFLIIIGLNMLIISMCFIRILMRIGNSFEVFRLGLVNIGQLVHLFYNSLPGQKLIDSSTNIFRAVYFCNWYIVSKRSNTLLRLMMLRSMIPCRLTAGKFYVMSLENFALVLKTSLSYFTVLTSFR